MTDGDWPSCADPDQMLDHLGPQISERKLRLFACACCRRIEPRITIPACLRSLEVAEEYADELVTEDERETTFTAAGRSRSMFVDGNLPAVWVTAPEFDRVLAGEVARLVAQTLAQPTAAAAFDIARAAQATGAPAASQNAAWASYDTIHQQAVAVAQQVHADLLREIIGNPFHGVEALPEPSVTLVSLATALYAGEDCAFALHDTLLEIGRDDLAQHFQTAHHPKGCWALDLILGKC